MDYAIVIAAEVALGQGVLASEPVTTATLRDASGRERVVRVVGGRTGGGLTYLSGYVVPVVGARVRADLREPPRPAAPPALGAAWTANTPAGTWDDSRMPIPFFLALPESRDLGAGAALELDLAARTWGRAPCTSFRAQFGGARPALLPGDDGVNGVFFHDDAWPAALVPGALAQTIVHLDASGKLHDADVHVNGAEYRFSLDGAPGTHDARGVLVHELGHALGLGHSEDARATMSVSGSGLRWRSLERDDVDGVCALYPGVGAAGCDVDPCPRGSLCVAGACQRAGDRADVCAPCSLDVGACEAAGDEARCVEIGAGGRVCGRACAGDADCGAGFACRPTTEAGDLQCISTSGCRNGASPCTQDADCTHSGAACRDGACVAPTAERVDAGGRADAGPRAEPEPAAARGEGCDCAAGGSAPPPLLLVVGAWAAALLMTRRARRRASTRRSSPRPSRARTGS